MKNTLKAFIPSLLVFVLMLAGCSAPQNKTKKSSDNKTTEDVAQTSNVKKAVAVIHSNDGQINAVVTFTKTENGVKVHGEFSGLKKGMHAYHVHQYGDCRADAYSSAGGHLQFKGEGTTGPNNPITGNLGNIMANPNGMAVTDTVITAINFENLIGRAVMIHEHGNDLSPPPPGQSGARIACGAIGIANPNYGTSSM